MSEFVTVANVDDVPEGEGRRFEFGDRIIAIFNVDGKFSAIDDMCPHMGASLSEGHFDRESCTVVCPWHSWRFNVIDGTWADNPRVKTDCFELKVVANEIQVRPPEQRESDA